MTDLLTLFGQVLAVTAGICAGVIVVFGTLLWVLRRGQESADKKGKHSDGKHFNWGEEQS